MSGLLNYNSPSSIKAFLDDYKIAPQKRFGQNFLINAQARAALSGALNIKTGETVWEIGAGLGAMTKELLEQGAALTCFEIDRGYIKILRGLFSNEICENRLSIIEGDVLKTWKKAPNSAGAALKLFGNLPYNIGALLLGDFIENGLFFSRIAVTLQKEAALRICAKTGEKHYSSLAVLFSLFYTYTKIMSMNGSFFYPPPAVESLALLFEKKENTPKIPECFFAVTRALFAQRRKTVHNNLLNFLKKEAAYSKIDISTVSNSAAISEKILSECNISQKTRPCELTPEDFLRIADYLQACIFTQR